MASNLLAKSSSILSTFPVVTLRKDHQKVDSSCVSVLWLQVAAETSRTDRKPLGNLFDSSCEFF